MLRRSLFVLGLPLLAVRCSTSRGGGRPVRGYEGGGGQSCVPFARQRSGIALQGDAWQWWTEAEGRYARGGSPRAGSVLVFARTARLRTGHLSVVSRVISAREIRVDHANWAPAGTSARGMIARDQPVQDLSDAGDWSALRVWYPPSDQFGVTTYPAWGFIHSARA
jgi:surface antigen